MEIKDENVYVYEEDDLLPYVYKVNMQFDYTGHESEKTTADIGSGDYDYDDYLEVLPYKTSLLEYNGAENSLFLAIARSLLYNINFVERDILNKICLDNSNENLKLGSDLNLQQVLRKHLCMYWLSNVKNGVLKHDSKYSR